MPPLLLIGLMFVAVLCAVFFAYIALGAVCDAIGWTDNPEMRVWVQGWVCDIGNMVGGFCLLWAILVVLKLVLGPFIPEGLETNF